MDPNPDIHLREYLEMRIECVRNAIITRLDLEKQAIEKQDIENLRRLDDLNHAAETAQAKEQHFLPRETWEQFVKDNDLWRQGVLQERAAHVTLPMHAQVELLIERLAARVDVLEKASANLTGRLWAAGVGLSILVIILNFIIRAAPKP